MLQEIWHTASRSSRIGIVSGTVVILILMLVAGYSFLRDKKEVLFTDLEPADAASVVAELERMKVEYALEQDARRILVPADEVHQVRLKLMGSGLAMGGGVGFELFDNSEFGMTEFAQRINFQRALQGELTRTIMSLEEIKVARVHLVMPEASLFKQNKNQPSASVTLFLKLGKRLDQAQVEGIQRLVSASVPGLEAAMVTVVDQKGSTMSRVISGEDEIASVSTRLQKKQEVENYLRVKVASVLESAFGPGKAIVSIDVTLNFNQEKTTREDVIPRSDQNGGIVRQRESHSGDAQGSGEAEGTSNTEVEYQLGHTVAQIISTPGNIQRLSVGVLVPWQTNKEKLSQIQDLVAMTVGLNRERGDAIAVHASKDAPVKPITQDEEKHTTETVPTLPSESFGLVNSENSVAAGAKIGRSDDKKVMNDIVGWIQKMWHGQAEIMTALVAMLIFTLLLSVYGINTLRRRQIQLQNRKTDAEREEILEQLREWLKTDELTAQTEPGAS